MTAQFYVKQVIAHYLGLFSFLPAIETTIGTFKVELSPTISGCSHFYVKDEEYEKKIWNVIAHYLGLFSFLLTVTATGLPLYEGVIAHYLGLFSFLP